MNVSLIFVFLLFCLILMPRIINAAPLKPCSRGSLDESFCDNDNDLLADPPDDPSEWLDPYPLVFAYTPVEDPIVYQNAWADFIVHMEKVTKRKVELFPIQSNAAEIKAMRIGKIHVAGFNSGSNPLAVNCAGFHPFTLMAKEDNSFGYQMEIITYPGSKIERVLDIKGKLLAFTAPTSNSGFKAASAILEKNFNLIKGRDFKFTFSGRHDASILGVKNKQYPAASIAGSVRKRMFKRGLLKESDLSILYTSQTFPNTGFGYVYNLKPDLVKSIKKAFSTFQWTKPNGSPSSLKAEFQSSGYTQFMPINYKKDWKIIREIDKANNESYLCR